MSSQKILLELPEETFTRLEATIQRCVEESLMRNVDKLRVEPELLSRDQVAKRLRITAPTLRRLEVEGKLVPQRAGRRVLYNARTVENFLNAGTG